MRVIVTNAKSRIAYVVIKSLSKKGIEVIAADSNQLAMSFYSKYTTGHFLYPSPYKKPEQFIKSIIDNAIAFKANIIIPTYEETFLLSKNKEKISKYLKFAIPDYEQIILTHNKTHWIPVAERLNIPTPKTISVNTLLKDKNTEQFRYPVLIKPVQGGGGWAIEEFNSANKLSKILALNSYCNLPWERFFVQEKIKGQTICTAMLFNSGKFKAKVTYRTVRQFPLEAGQATFRVSIKHQAAEDYFQKMLEKIKWHGVCQADFIIEEQSGIPYLIDINPRFWGAIDQAIAAKVDFPYLLYQIIIKGDIPLQKDFTTEKYSRWLGGDLMAFVSMFCKKGANLTDIKSFFSKDTNCAYCADFSYKDPLPFIIWGIDTINKKLRKKHDSLEGIWE